MCLYAILSYIKKVNNGNEPETAEEQTYLLDMPHGFQWKGVYVDAALRTVQPVPAVSTVQTVNRQKTFMQLSALQGSILENRIFEDDFKVESISTAKLIQISNQPSALSAQLFKIDKTNIDSVFTALSVDDNIKEDITNAVNQDLVVYFPQAYSLPLTAMSYKDWTGIGYIKENPDTGEAGYMLSGTIAGGMTAQTPEQWANQYLREKLDKPYSGQWSKGPAARIIKILVTDRQYGTVGMQLKQPLSVLVADINGLPVKGANVTFRVIAGGGNFGKNLLQQPQTTLEVKTGRDGVAKAQFFLGTKTYDNPVYKKLAAQDEYLTQIGLNLVTAATGSIVIQQPFNLYGVPDAPFEIKKIYGDGAVGMANNPAGGLLVRVVDKYGNPISNREVRMKTVGIQPRYAGTVLPPQPRGVQFYDRQTCANVYPLYGDCPSKTEIILITEYFGAIATGIFGDTVATRYSVEASVVNSDLLPTYFELYTSGFRAADNYIPPGVYLRYLQPVNDSGQPINASRAGTPLKAPLTAEFILMRDDVGLEGPAPCSSGEGSCWRLVSTGKVITEKITNGTVAFAAVAGGGTAGQTVNLNNGKYRTTYTTGPQPMVNLVEAGGSVTITVPTVRYNPMVTGTVIPSFDASYSGTTKPLAITEYKDTSLQCSNGTCKLPEASVSLKGGQQVIFYAGEQPQAAGLEQKAKYTLYGVDVTVAMEPKVLFLNEKGYSYADTKINYTILPPEYNAAIVDIDLYKDGAWQGYLVGGATQGTDTATIASGSVIDVNSAYSVQAVLNRGSDVEIKGAQISLPVAKINKIEVYDKNNKCNRAPHLNNVLYNDLLIVGADYSNNSATVGLRIDLGGSGDEISKASLLWRITGENVDPSSGSFAGADPTATATASLLFEYDYPVEIFIDSNGNGLIDNGDSVVRTFNVKVISKNNYILSKEWLGCIAKPEAVCIGALAAGMVLVPPPFNAEFLELYALASAGGLLDRPLASSFLLTFLDKASDAPVKPDAISQPTPDDINLLAGSLTTKVGVNFDAQCNPTWPKRVYNGGSPESQQAIRSIVNSPKIIERIKVIVMNMEHSTAINKYYAANPTKQTYSYPIQIIENINFREYYKGDFTLNNLGLAFGEATVNFGPVMINTSKSGSAICVAGAHIQGTVDDLYDFNYFASVLFAKRGAVIQSGWTSKLGMAGAVFQSHFDINENISLDFCLN